MDTLDNTDWDVVIVGTGLQQSLLALYVYTLHSSIIRNLTDLVHEEPCRARGRNFYTSMQTTTMAAPRLPLACRKLRLG
jgi:hypothetical protein